MNWKRVWHTLGMCMQPSGQKRAAYLRKHNVLGRVGEKCMVMPRKVPLYPEQITLGNNVWVATGVTFATHDAIHKMLNNCMEGELFKENIGHIEIKDNVFVGANTTILPGVTIGPNAIVAAGSVVNKSIGEGVYGGVPAKYICSFDEFVDKRRRMSAEDTEK